MADQRVGLSQYESFVALDTPVGVIYFDLSQTERIEEWCQQMERAIELLRKTKMDYDRVW